MGIRLQKYERAAIDLSLGYKNFFSYFDQKNKIYFNTDSFDYKNIIEPSITLGLRILYNLEPFIKIPLVYKVGHRSNQAGISSINTGIALNIFEQLKISLPFFLRISSSIGIPISKLVLDYPIFFNSLLIEKPWGNILLGFNYVLGLPFLTKDKLAPRHTHNLSFSMGSFLYEKGFFNFSLGIMLHGKVISHQGPISDSNKYNLNMGISWLHKLHTHVKLHSQIGLDVPVNYLGKNTNNYFYGSLGLRLGIF